MSATPIQRADETAPAPSRSLRMLLSSDPLLFLAAIGLAAFSVVTLHGAGSPISADADKQALFAGIGLAAAIVISR